MILKISEKKLRVYKMEKGLKIEKYFTKGMNPNVFEHFDWDK